MRHFLTGKFRLLYLLALVQLMGGRLVHFQVTVVCQLTPREPRIMGMTKAAVLALESANFQQHLAAPEIADQKSVKGPGDPA